MALTEQFSDFEETHPIDVVEHLAEMHDWNFDRVTDDQIAMIVEGQWRSYSITLAWSAVDQTLRLISTFDLDPPQDRLAQLYECINLANDCCWSGAFTLWPQQQLMVWRYGLVLSGDQIAGKEQIDTMIDIAVTSAERFYPAFQLVAWADKSAEQAMGVAISGAYGHA